PLVAASRARGNLTQELSDHFAWQPFLVTDKTINAFALPGGYVGVHLGLISMTATSDELASVLAHEMSHVTQRHIARMIGNEQRVSMVGIASMILGILAAARSPQAGEALIVGGQAVTAQGQLNFSRDREREADRVGFGVLQGAGYQPAGMAGMFERLAAASRLTDSGDFPYLRSHPLTTERIGEARARLGVNADENPAMSKNLLEHAAYRGRARALMDPRAAALARVAANEGGAATSKAERLTSVYAAALAATKLKEWPRADEMLAQARELAQGDAGAARAVALLQAESSIERGDAARAAAALAPHAGDGTRPVAMLQARLALLPGTPRAQLRRSVDELQTWVALHPKDALAWTYAAQAWERLDEPLRAVRAQAEVRVAIGDYDGAVDRLHAGQTLARKSAARDSIEASVIEARMRDVQALRRREMADERGNNKDKSEEPKS
ncbi:MAG TPA: M48 family metalloprotease, partial [Methylibium sp.]